MMQRVDVPECLYLLSQTPAHQTNPAKTIPINQVGSGEAGGQRSYMPVRCQGGLETRIGKKF